MGKVSERATAIISEEGYTKVVYHSTCVVKWNQERIILDSGKWQTATTKTRMNQASNQFDLGYRVFQKDYEWFVEWKGETLEFFDGIELQRMTKIENAKFTGSTWMDEMLFDASVEGLPRDWNAFSQMLANANDPAFPAFETEEETDAAYDSAWETMQRFIENQN
jgi:hypothetical protein